ncbi:uncharacterized protein SCHCODRAFT_02607221, partial [Schizophyllum commune H4-8]|uniref:uncharacterized protein n=1 Tax=Schizophyllum commune (strain H4-8 / FGSC 9210) TaxID=578458 RepID=UPI00215FD64D
NKAIHRLIDQEPRNRHSALDVAACRNIAIAESIVSQCVEPVDLRACQRWW